jgi:hypothetical protein
MNPPIPRRFLLALALVATAGGAPLRAQVTDKATGLGRVQGLVRDSTAGEPLPNAAVVLWGTPHRAVTDADGRFEMIDVPPGAYSMHFFHTRLGELGISPGPLLVTVSAGTVSLVELGTPSWFTVVSSQCLLEDPAPGTGTLAGWVGDGDSGMGMPQARVQLAWPITGNKEPARMEVETDASGWFRVCGAPADVPIMASARFLSLQGLRREVVVREGVATEAGFLLWKFSPARVAGAVHDATSGLAVNGAEVWLRGTSFRAITNGEGAFSFGEVPPGTYTLLADHLQYGTRQDTLIVPSGRTLTVDMRVDTRAIELDPLTVEVESVPLTRRAMGGLSISRSQIDELGNRVRDTAEILQRLNVPGVIVRRRGDGSVCVGFMPGQARIMAGGGCVSMEVYINDVHATSAEMALHIPPEAVDRIVLFRPVEAGNLFPINAANGVMVIYTRR